MTGIRTPIESCPHWSAKTTSKQTTSFPGESNAHPTKDHTAPRRSIGGQSRPGSRVELRRFLLSSAAGDVYKGATVSGESRCVESWLCAIFITCMVHGSVDLPSALVHCYIRCENVGGCGAHETVFDCHDVAFDHECPISTCPGQCCVCVRPVVLFSVTAGSQAVLWHCIDCSANSLPVC